MAMKILNWLSPLKRHTKGSDLFRLPPMPKGHWLWGNVFDIDKAIEQFRTWQKEYGDIYRLNIAGLKIIMVNHLKYLFHTL